MFDRIAPRYDAMNRVMTVGLDGGWRRAAARAANLGPGTEAIDVACGTGDLTRRLAAIVGPSGRVTGVDVSAAMLRRAARRAGPTRSAIPRYIRADALDLPLVDRSADAATIAFGLRNVAEPRRAVAEMLRVLRPGGRLVVLEIARPSNRFGRIVAWAWFDRAVPLIGRLAGAADAYGYLPASVRRYGTPEEVAAMMRDAGCVDVTWSALALGMVTLHVGRRPP